MKSCDLYKFYKEKFDSICRTGLTKEKLNKFLDEIANNDKISDRHYDSLRHYANEKYFELGGF